MKYDLAWGNSVAVREAFLNTYHGNPMVLAREDLAGLTIRFTRAIRLW